MRAPWQNIWPEWICERRVGSGSCGVVYRAYKEGNEGRQEAAIKVITLPRNPGELYALNGEGLTEDELKEYYHKRAEDLLTEVDLIRELGNHPHIVQVEDHALLPEADQPGCSLFIRMELLTPLSQRMAQKPLLISEVIQMGQDICRALEQCHSRGLLHRDIKPENIFLDKEGRFKLGDFGIARRLEGGSTYLTTVGTPLYMAPEVALGTHYDAAADIYSLGLVLYRLLNHNRLPFMNEGKLSSPTDRRRAMEWRIKGEKIPLPADAPREIGEVILKACAFKPKDRYASAGAFRKALEIENKKEKPVSSSWGKILLLACLALLLVFAVSDSLWGTPRYTAPASESGWETEQGKSSSDSYIPPITSAFAEETSGKQETDRSEGRETKESRDETKSGLSRTGATAASSSMAEAPTSLPAETEAAATTSAHVHRWSDWTVVLEASCTKEGKESHFCYECDATEELTIPAKGHIEVLDTETPASCLQDVFYDWKIRCSVCHKLLRQGQVVQRIPHIFENGVCTLCGNDLFEYAPLGDGSAYEIIGVNRVFDDSRNDRRDLRYWFQTQENYSYSNDLIVNYYPCDFPAYHNGKPVVGINNFFESDIAISRVTIPDTISYIRSRFSTWDNLLIQSDLTIDVPSSVHTIEVTDIVPAANSNMRWIFHEGLKYLSGLDTTQNSLILPDSLEYFSGSCFFGDFHLGANIIRDNQFFTGQVLPGQICNGNLTVSPQNPVYSASGNCLIKNKDTIIGHGKEPVIPDDGSIKTILYLDIRHEWNKEYTIPEGVETIETLIMSEDNILYLPESLKSFRFKRGYKYHYAGTMEQCMAMTDAEPLARVVCADGTIEARTQIGEFSWLEVSESEAQPPRKTWR